MVCAEGYWYDVTDMGTSMGTRRWEGTAAQALKVLAAGPGMVGRGGDGGVVLLYHRVGGTSGLAVDLPTALFAAQVDELSDTHARRVVTLDELLTEVSRESPPPTPPLALTFDDGTADFVDTVLPILHRAGLPATLFVATDFVETGRSFPREGKPLSWNALRDALSTGLVTIGSHTHTHALLDRLPGNEVEPELDRSIALIQERLGVTPRHFAYPKALLGSPTAQAAVRQRFQSASLAGTRPNRYGRTDPYRLNRSPIQVTDGMRWFRHKVRGRMSLEDDVRRLVNRRRYARAVT